jgi:hypothetical protein
MADQTSQFPPTQKKATEVLQIKIPDWDSQRSRIDIPGGTISSMQKDDLESNSIQKPL